MKFKRMADEEFIVAGYIRKGAHTFSLVLAKYRNGELAYQGHVTSGVTGADTAGLSAAEKSPFQVLLPGNGDAVWVKPDRVCVVEYMPNTLNALRQPVFKEYRDDVFPTDIKTER